MQTGVQKLPPYNPIPTSSLCAPLAHSPLPCEGKIPRLVGEAGGGGRATRGNLEHAGASSPVASVSSPPLSFLTALFYAKGNRAVRYLFTS